VLGIPEWAIGVGVIILCVATGQVLVRWLAPGMPRRDLKSPLANSTARGQALEDVQVRLDELDQLKQRMSELEERVDFAERLLSKQREGRRLGPPQD